MWRNLFMCGSIEILASFLVIPVNINLRGFFNTYIKVLCLAMACRYWKILLMYACPD